MRVPGLAIAIAVLAGCNGSANAGPITAPQTTAAPATTPGPAPITTATAPAIAAPLNSSPPSTAPVDAGEDAKAAVATRYESFSLDANDCVAAGRACDFPSRIGPYVDSIPDLFGFYTKRWTDLIEGDWTVQDSSQIDRWVESVDIEDDTAYVVGCVIDRQIVVDNGNAVVDDEVGYREEETIWSLVDGQWLLVGGTVYIQTNEPGASVCNF